MKKLLSIVAVAALINTGANAADNQIALGGTVLVDGYVGFAAATVQAKTLVGTGTAQMTGLFVDDALNTLTFLKLGGGGISAGGQFVPIHRDIYVKSNAQSGVTMALDNVGPMITDDGDAADEKMELAYTYAGTAITANTPFTVLAAGSTSDGGTKVNGDDAGFKVTPAQATPLQVAGDYTTTVAVTIKVN